MTYGCRAWVWLNFTKQMSSEGMTNETEAPNTRIAKQESEDCLYWNNLPSRLQTPPTQPLWLKPSNQDNWNDQEWLIPLFLTTLPSKKTQYQDNQVAKDLWVPALGSRPQLKSHFTREKWGHSESLPEAQSSSKGNPKLCAMVSRKAAMHRGPIIPENLEKN